MSILTISLVLVTVYIVYRCVEPVFEHAISIVNAKQEQDHYRCGTYMTHIDGESPLKVVVELHQLKVYENGCDSSSDDHYHGFDSDSLSENDYGVDHFLSLNHHLFLL